MGASSTSAITVLGAGVIGVTSAYFLARAGYRVTVVEREQEPGLGTSGENGAQLSYGFADPISGQATLRRLPAIVMGRDRGISVHGRHLLAAPWWTLSFLRNCRSARARDNAAALTSLALASRRFLEQIRTDTGIEFDFRRNGRLVLYSDPGSLLASQSSVESRAALGCDLRVLSKEQCLELEGALEGWAEPLAGGIYSESDEVGDVQAFCRALAAYCANALGVKFRFGQAVTAVRREQGRVTGLVTNMGELNANRILVCLGPQAGHLMSALGERLPILPLKGYSITLPATHKSPNLSVASAERRIVFARIGDRMRIAGLAHVRGEDRQLEPRHVEAVLDEARLVFPTAGDFEAPLSGWCGLRPLTPDGLPRIGATACADVYVNAGHGGLGWTLAAGSAALVTSIIGGAAIRRFGRGHDVAALGATMVAPEAVR